LNVIKHFLKATSTFLYYNKEKFFETYEN
jgi:hypothetical protein